MKTDELIPAKEFCIYHNIELSFIYSLNEAGLIEIVFLGEHVFVPLHQITQLERIIRFHFEMDINLAGIETITHLLHQMKKMQQYNTQLLNRLSVYENERTA